MDGFCILYHISCSFVDHIALPVKFYVQQVGVGGWLHIHGHDFLEFGLEVCQGEFITDHIADAVLGSQLLCIIREHIGAVFSCIMVVVHNHRLYFR